MAVVGKNEIYHWGNLVGPFLVHKLLGPRPPPSPSSLLIATGGQPQWLWPHVSWGAVAAGTPAGCAVGHDITAPPPPPPPMGTSRGGGRGQGRGHASLVDVFGSISAALTAAARADGTRGDPPPPRDCEQQGAAGRLRAGQGPGASPPLSKQGQQGAAGQDLGQQSAAGRAVVQAQGQPEAAGLGQGVRDRVRDRVVPLSPRRGAAPPLPSVGGQDRHRSAAMRHGGAGQRVGQTVSGAPHSTGVRRPVCRPAGGGS